VQHELIITEPMKIVFANLLMIIISSSTICKLISTTLQLQSMVPKCPPPKRRWRNCDA